MLNHLLALLYFLQAPQVTILLPSLRLSPLCSLVFTRRDNQRLLQVVIQQQNQLKNQLISQALNPALSLLDCRALVQLLYLPVNQREDHRDSLAADPRLSPA